MAEVLSLLEFMLLGPSKLQSILATLLTNGTSRPALSLRLRYLLNLLESHRPRLNCSFQYRLNFIFPFIVTQYGSLI
jgi:hypothetical protein